MSKMLHKALDSYEAGDWDKGCDQHKLFNDAVAAAPDAVTQGGVTFSADVAIRRARSPPSSPRPAPRNP